MTIKTKPATDEYRDNWDRIFGEHQWRSGSAMFDEQPYGATHGVCAAEILRLTNENKTLRDTLRGIAESDWRKWDDDVRSPYEFVKWAKSRAQHTLVALGAYSVDLDAANEIGSGR